MVKVRVGGEVREWLILVTFGKDWGWDICWSSVRGRFEVR